MTPTEPKPIDMGQFEGHTPGPWVLDTAVHRNGKRTAAVYHYPHEAWCVEIVESAGDENCIHGNLTGTEDERWTNARLIAAAPELLAEVRRLREAMETINQATSNWVANNGDPCARLIRDIARKALAQEPAP